MSAFFKFDDLLRRIAAVAFEIGALCQIDLGQSLGDLLVADAFVHLVHEADVVVQGGHELGERCAFEHRSTFAVAHHDAVGGALDHDLHEFGVVLDVLLELALLDAVERRLRDEHVAALDQLLHVTEEKREQQGADVRAVDVGVGHQDDLAVAQFRYVEVVLADAGAERRDHGADFLVAQHLVVARFLDVEDLSLERQDRLEAAVAALLGGAAGALALDQVHFAAVRLTLGAVGQLARQSAAVQRSLAARQVAGLAGGFTRACCVDGLVDDLLGDRRVLVEERAQTLVDECLHRARDIGVELALGLAFELRLRKLHADYGYQSFANVIAGEVFLHVLEQPKLLARIVHGASQRGAEARQVRPAIDGVDVVGEAEHRLGVGVVVLQRDFHGNAIALGFHVDRLVVQDGLAAVQVLDELGDAAIELEFRALGLAGFGIGRALVGERDQQSLVEECQLAQALRKRVVVVFGDGEDRGVGHEVHFGSALLRIARLLQPAGWFALGVGLLPHSAVAPDFQLEQLAERVHAGNTDAVQSAGNFVVRAVELAARVQNRHHHLGRGDALAIDIHISGRDAASVVHYRDGVVDMDGDVNVIGITRQRFVHRVVDHFVHQVVQAHLAS